MILSTAQETAIRNALNTLLKNDSMDAFLVITEQHSGKFIQFEMGNEHLILDLPTQQFNKTQKLKAQEILSSYTIPDEKEEEEEVDEVDTAEDDETVIDNDAIAKESIAGFNQKISSDLDIVMEIINKVIDQVFELKDAIELELEEN